MSEGILDMNLAKISANGQLTLPVEIRRLLGVGAGDKVLFYEKENCEIVVSSASAQSVRKAQSESKEEAS